MNDLFHEIVKNVSDRSTLGRLMQVSSSMNQIACKRVNDLSLSKYYESIHHQIFSSADDSDESIVSERLKIKSEIDGWDFVDDLGISVSFSLIKDMLWFICKSGLYRKALAVRCFCIKRINGHDSTGMRRDFFWLAQIRVGFIVLWKWDNHESYLVDFSNLSNITLKHRNNDDLILDNPLFPFFMKNRIHGPDGENYFIKDQNVDYLFTIVDRWDEVVGLIPRKFYYGFDGRVETESGQLCGTFGPRNRYLLFFIKRVRAESSICVLDLIKGGLPAFHNFAGAHDIKSFTWSQSHQILTIFWSSMHVKEFSLTHNDNGSMLIQLLSNGCLVGEKCDKRYIYDDTTDTNVAFRFNE